jgi:hypothetical protein
MELNWRLQNYDPLFGETRFISLISDAHFKTSDKSYGLHMSKKPKQRTTHILPT